MAFSASVSFLWRVKMLLHAREAKVVNDRVSSRCRCPVAKPQQTQQWFRRELNPANGSWRNAKLLHVAVIEADATTSIYIPRTSVSHGINVVRFNNLRNRFPLYTFSFFLITNEFKRTLRLIHVAASEKRWVLQFV